jgi:hypothetical protein
MSLREIDRAPSDMSADSSTNTSFVMEETTTVDSVEYIKDKIHNFLFEKEDDSIINSMNSRYIMANQILKSSEYISLPSQIKNDILIATLLSIFNDYKWDNWKFNIDSFINISNDDKKEVQYMLELCDNIDSSLDVDSYKLIPRYIAIINEFSAIGIIEYIKNIKKDELYSKLKTYLSVMKDKIDSNNEYINHQYNIIKNLIKQINDYMSKNSTISIEDIENILF